MKNLMIVIAVACCLTLAGTALASPSSAARSKPDTTGQVIVVPVPKVCKGQALVRAKQSFVVTHYAKTYRKKVLRILAKMSPAQRSALFVRADIPCR